MEERDWQKDWDTCEKATPGPWQRSRFVDHRRYAHIPEEWKEERRRREELTIRGPGVVGTPGCNVVMRLASLSNAADMDFVLAAREALPYWLQRVKELEERLRRLEGQKCETCKRWRRDPDWPFWGNCEFLSLPEGHNYVLAKMHRALCERGHDCAAIVGYMTRLDFGCVCWEARE